MLNHPGGSYWTTEANQLFNESKIIGQGPFDDGFVVSNSVAKCPYLIKVLIDLAACCLRIPGRVKMRHDVRQMLVPNLSVKTTGEHFFPGYKRQLGYHFSGSRFPFSLRRQVSPHVEFSAGRKAALEGRIPGPSVAVLIRKRIGNGISNYDLAHM